jgi:hypothetical protein
MEQDESGGFRKQYRNGRWCDTTACIWHATEWDRSNVVTQKYVLRIRVATHFYYFLMMICATYRIDSNTSVNSPGRLYPTWNGVQISGLPVAWERVVQIRGYERYFWF